MTVPVKACELCPGLCGTRSSIVNGRGPAERPDFMVVGDGPNWEDDEAGKPWAGKNGHVLAALFKEAGISTRDVYLTHATRCYGGRTHKPNAKEIDACRPYLIEEIRRVNPKVIISVGAPPLRALYKQVPITDVLGQTLVQPDTGIPLIATYAPGYLMKKKSGGKGGWGESGKVVSHLAKAARVARHGLGKGDLGTYTPVLTLEDLRDLELVLNADDVEWFSIDTETCNGLSWMTNEIITIQFAPRPQESYVVPIMFKATEDEYDEDGKLLGPGKPNDDFFLGHLAPAWTEEEWPEAHSILGRIFSSGKPKGFQGGIYDLAEIERDASSACVEALTAYGWHVENYVIDTLMLGRALDESLPNDLDALTARETDIPYYSGEVMVHSKRKRKMELLPNHMLWKYGGGDTSVTQIVEPSLREQVRAQGSEWLVDNVSVPIVRCAWEMSRRGVLVDMAYFNDLCALYREKIAAWETELYALVGHEFKWKYSPAVQKVLHDELKLPRPKGRTKGAKECEDCKALDDRDDACDKHSPTGADALKEIYALSSHEVCPLLIAMKKAYKFYSTNLDGGKGGFRRWIRPDGRIHPKWKPSSAETGRFACEEPSLMNLPKSVEVQEGNISEHNAMRRVFIAPEGRGLINADWNQLEVWGLAYETGDEVLLGLLMGGEDVHTYVARKMCEMHINEAIFPDVDRELPDWQWRAAHEELRRKAKVFVFGLSYGMTEEGVSVRLNCDNPTAKILIDAFLTIFPTLRAYFERIRKAVLRDHRIPNWAGRWRHFPEIGPLVALRYSHDIDASCREAVNFPVQSGGHDLHSSVHILTERSEALKRRDAQIVMEVHDSLTIEAPWPNQEYMIQTAWIIKDLWETTAKTLIKPNGDPLAWQVPVEVEWGKSLGTPAWKLTARGDVVEIKDEAA